MTKKEKHETRNKTKTLGLRTEHCVRQKKDIKMNDFPMDRKCSFFFGNFHKNEKPSICIEMIS